MATTTNDERPEDAPTGQETAGPTRTLLVDDHSVFRAALGIVLERRAGFGESVHAGSLAEARRALEDRRNGRKSQFDLAVVDLDLPSGDGFELLEELREAAPGVPVIAVTASPDSDLRARALGAGASEVLATTASGEEVVATAKRLGG